MLNCIANVRANSDKAINIDHTWSDKKNLWWQNQSSRATLVHQHSNEFLSNSVKDHDNGTLAKLVLLYFPRVKVSKCQIENALGTVGLVLCVR